VIRGSETAIERRFPAPYSIRWWTRGEEALAQGEGEGEGISITKTTIQVVAIS